MNIVIVTLLVLCLAVVLVGSAIQGLFWMTLVAMALILGIGAVAEATHPPRM